MTKKKARRPKLSSFSQMDRRLRLGESLVKCCGSCQHYKRDYKCRLDSSVVVLSTTEPIECRFWRPSVHPSLDYK